MSLTLHVLHPLQTPKFPKESWDAQVGAGRGGEGRENAQNVQNSMDRRAQALLACDSKADQWEVRGNFFLTMIIPSFAVASRPYARVPTYMRMGAHLCCGVLI